MSLNFKFYLCRERDRLGDMGALIGERLAGFGSSSQSGDGDRIV